MTGVVVVYRRTTASKAIATNVATGVVVAIAGTTGLGVAVVAIDVVVLDVVRCSFVAQGSIWEVGFRRWGERKGERKRKGVCV